METFITLLGIIAVAFGSFAFGWCCKNAQNEARNDDRIMDDQLQAEEDSSQLARNVNKITDGVSQVVLMTPDQKKHVRLIVYLALTENQ